ncbi:hypothetical protein ROE7235_01937 [Roseibaca ekhonensis]|uniref:PPC domain-containing protein n=1 Tax=Roseinatronobacter ekhonensis TaxID=254356 RepID=A0A3B0M940_9RHOB|nr:DUF296 domain-containing protein [Roseibaca ekhonensis]SUZ32183.1 hypothetical protein ROE7235_01937 [Roseibaca ekhonensis]
MMRHVVHPGPAVEPRATALPVQAHPVEVVLRAGLPIGQAVAQALDGFDGGFLDLRDVGMDPLAYVIPGPAQNGHAAWYSETHMMGAGATILRGCVHMGWREGARFTHTHGIWTDASGRRHMGHILPDQAEVARDCTVRGWGLSGGCLEARPDPETAFTLFRPEPHPRRTGGTPAHLVTLRPNQDIGAALVGLGLTGRVMGLGSLIGTRMQDGTALESYATEIFLTDGHISPMGAQLDAASIGLDGRMIEGRLAEGVNAVLVTAELLVLTK